MELQQSLLYERKPQNYTVDSKILVYATENKSNLYDNVLLNMTIYLKTNCKPTSISIIITSVKDSELISTKTFVCFMLPCLGIALKSSFFFCFLRHIASFLSVFKLLVIGVIIIGRDPFALFGMQAPGIWEWGQGNKVRFTETIGVIKALALQSLPFSGVS